MQIKINKYFQIVQLFSLIYWLFHVKINELTVGGVRKAVVRGRRVYEKNRLRNAGLGGPRCFYNSGKKTPSKTFILMTAY